jgi:hypothetical protein
MRDGYFDNDDLLNQVENAIDIFDRMYPDAQALFLFDNATTHQKRAADALSAKHMPKSCKIWRPGQLRMRDATFNGTEQPLYWPDNHSQFPGCFKGMKQIIQERGLWRNGLKAQCKSTCWSACTGTACCCRRILFNQPDFVNQKSALEELIEDRGHLCTFYPKFHCELNFIEQYWGAAKYRYRATPLTESIEEMERNVMACLDNVPLDQLRRSVQCLHQVNLTDLYFNQIF